MSSVTLGMTTKGINSTSRQISGGVTVDAKLKDPVCGLHKPVFKLKGLSKSYNNYNYCIWRGRYYWVDEIVFLTNDIQEVHCHLDPLATFKGAIDETPAFVVYGDKAHCDGYVDDNRIGPERMYGTYATPMDIGFTTSLVWTVIVYTQGAVSLTENEVGIYAMTEDAFWDMLAGLYNTIDDVANNIGPLSGLGAVWADIYRITSQGTPIENIKGAIAIPVPYARFQNLGPSKTSIYLGGYEVNVLCTKIPPRVRLDKSFEIPFNRSTLADQYRFLSSSKYLTAQIIHPGGSMPINIDAAMEMESIWCHSSICLATGDYVLKVTPSSTKYGQTLGFAAGNLSFNLMDLISNAKSQLNAILDKGMDIGASLAKMIPNPVIQTAASVTESNIHSIDMKTGEESVRKVISSHDTPYQVRNEELSTSGISGAFRPGNYSTAGSSISISSTLASLGVMQSDTACHFNLTYFEPQIVHDNKYEAFCDEYGYPCNKYVEHLNEISGYVQCAGAFVNKRSSSSLGGATPADISTINSFLNNGIVLED